MKKNIDTQGRILRLILAFLLLAFSFWQKSWLMLLGSLFVFYEALASWCVVYWLLGKNSCPLEPPKK